MALATGDRLRRGVPLRLLRLLHVPPLHPPSDVLHHLLMIRAPCCSNRFGPPILNFDFSIPSVMIG
ncbi:hypothetical protein SLEP1_g5019 [Rubroshorea leprosula]|uniref:Uncharacterized protein n=1 Tax=Rubroshorea leprosula TaxID=152421 RepID=A0AAV5HQL4_9ROSI|nr:hypothetical protein SLEP1_g5019 [Rubroshorea leprosula]